MKIFPFLALTLLLFSCQKDHIPNETKELDLQWEFRQVGTDNWYPATVPGVVHTDLLNNGLIEDPYWENNEQKLQWIEQENWEYKSILKLAKKQLQNDHLELVFEGLDTYAEIYLNDSLVLKTNNMFRSWTLDIKPYVVSGNNELKVLFISPITYNKEKVANHPYQYPSGCEKVDVKVSPFTRKAAYHFGWDWGPRFVTCGIWRPIKIHTWNNVQITDVEVYTSSINENDATIRIRIDVDVNKLDIENLKFKLAFNDTIIYSPVNSELSVHGEYFRIKNPKLWWCNGLGEPHLELLRVDLIQKKKIIDSREIRYGIRTIELVNESDSIGTAFYFKLNGKPVFAKGANYIPQDMFLPRVKDEQYIKLISDVKNANMNMLRVWGGGIYENDIFYDLCDENGILVWQDFMFTGSLYPGDQDFIENVFLEVEENVIRLQNHPSLAVFCGNNEIEVAWNNWGWQKQYAYSAKDSTQIWKDYERLFQYIIPKMVISSASNIPYTSTSPLSNWGTVENFNHSSMHYWGVWHGREPFENFENNVGRFMVEYGFQSFPSMETIHKFASDSSLYLASVCMKNRQKSYIGNGLILDHIRQYYHEPKSFEEIVNLSQEVQAKGIQMAIHSHINKQPHCMGSLFWQLNDCWPGPSWSVIDYYGKHKKAYEVVKEEFK